MSDCNHLYSRGINEPRPRICELCGKPEITEAMAEKFIRKYWDATDDEIDNLRKMLQRMPFSNYDNLLDIMVEFAKANFIKPAKPVLEEPKRRIMVVLSRTSTGISFEFSPSCEYLAMSKEEAIDLAHKIIIKANETTK